MQRVAWLDSGGLKETTFPHCNDEVLPGVRWGSPGEVLSPAFWAMQSRDSRSPLHGFAEPQGTLVEEVGFCLLGGFGVKVEVAEAFHRELLVAGAYDAPFLSRSQLEEILAAPTDLGHRMTRYRYPKQRAERLAKALPQLGSARFQTNDAAQLRRALLRLPGIGPKTASWIVRNWLGSDEVAILDIHVVRACQVIGLFPKDIRLPQQYDELEDRFIEFSRQLGVPASVLDAVIWQRMREFSPRTLQRLT